VDVNYDLTAHSPASILTSGRSPVLIDPSFRLLRIVDGMANLFVELLSTDGAPTGIKRNLVTLLGGDVMPLPSHETASARLVVVGIGDARVELLTDSDRQHIGAGFLVDGKKDCVSNALIALGKAAERGHMPLAGTTLGAGEALDAAEDEQRVTSHTATWLLGRVMGQKTDTSVQSGTSQVLGLASPNRTVTVDAGVAVQAVSTSDLVAGFGWEGLDQEATVLFEKIITVLYDDYEHDSKRRQESRERDRSEIENALTGLRSVIDRSAQHEITPPPDGEHPAVAALAAVCAQQKIDFEAPLSPVLDHDDPTMVLQDVMRNADLRSRQVELPAGWWKKDLGSFVGFDAETGDPIAVLRVGVAKYVYASPGNTVSEPVTRQNSDRIVQSSYFLFKPLPYRPLGGWDLVRHVLSTPAKTDLRIAGLIAMIVAALGLLPPIITGRLLNEVIPYAELHSLAMLAMGLVAISLGSAMFQFARSLALLRVEAFADGSLQAAIWDRLLRLPLAFFRRFEVGDLMIKAMAPTQLRQIVSDTALSSVLSAVFSLVNFFLMLSYDASLALAALLFTVVTCAILLGLSYLQLRFERIRLKADGALSSFTLQILHAIQKIRLMGAENRAFARWVEKFSHQRLQTNKAARVGNVTATLNQILPLTASIIFFAVLGFAEGSIPTGDFVAFNAAFGAFHSALLGVVGAVSTSLAAIPMYENMKPLLAEQPEIDPDRRPPGTLTGRVDIRNVSFRYNPEDPLVLDGVNITVEPGQFVAFVGPSGSGKSTLFRLLLGFETPENGAVSYDGQDIRGLDLKSVRRQTGVVLQRGAVLPGSIFENIVGAAPLSEDDAWEAARMAGFDEDIKNMPMGMHTLLNDGGGALSGGQRQRLMIARAIVRRPSILLMDEATSALDNRTQAIVAESLNHLNATRIVIAHRLSTVIHADRIFVIKAGEVVQHGSYDELIAVPGPFQDIAKPQLG
jgi:NHLM bacteriocin system ABC transporter ATP-binding protein